MAVLSVGRAEVVSILVRKQNGGRITAATYRQALAEFVSEIGSPSPVRAVSVDARR
jgi:hypothetical protein